MSVGHSFGLPATIVTTTPSKETDTMQTHYPRAPASQRREIARHGRHERIGVADTRRSAQEPSS